MSRKIHIPIVSENLNFLQAFNLNPSKILNRKPTLGRFDSNDYSISIGAKLVGNDVLNEMEAYVFPRLYVLRENDTGKEISMKNLASFIERESTRIMVDYAKPYSFDEMWNLDVLLCFHPQIIETSLAVVPMTKARDNIKAFIKEEIDPLIKGASAKEFQKSSLLPDVTVKVQQLIKEFEQNMCSLDDINEQYHEWTQIMHEVMQDMLKVRNSVFP